MHGEDHRGRGAGLADDRAELGDCAGAGAFAAEFHGYLDRKKSLRLHGVDGLAGEAALAIHIVGMGAGHDRDARGALGQASGG